MMRSTADTRLLSILVSSSLIACSMTAPLSAQSRVEVGTAASVVGDVQVQRGANGEERKLVRRQRVAWGDIISTDRRSQAQLLLLDRSSFGIGTRSRVAIDRFVYDPGKERSFFATLVKGALRYFSGSQDGNQSGEVQTGSGRIGIRGTAVDMFYGQKAQDVGKREDALDDVEDRKDEATMVILRGPGASTAGGLTPGLVEVEAAGVTVVLDEPGEAAYIPFIGAAPIGPFRISDRGLLQAQEQLAPEVKRANDGGFLRDILPVAAGLGAIAAGILLTRDGDDDNVPGVTIDPNGQGTSGGCPDPDVNGNC